MTVSLVVPVFNSADTLRTLTDRVASVFAGTAIPMELVLVNDGSSDSSWRGIRELADTFPWVRGVNLERNCGQQTALCYGIQSARGSVVVTLDDDLQYPPEAIPRLLNALESGVELVYGVPITRQHRFWRIMGSCLVRALLIGATAGSSRHFSPFRAFRTHLRDDFPECESTFIAIDIWLHHTVRGVTTVTVSHHKGLHRHSRYGLWRLVRLALGFVGEARYWKIRAREVNNRAHVCLVAETIGGGLGNGSMSG